MISGNLKVIGLDNLTIEGFAIASGDFQAMINNFVAGQVEITDWAPAKS